MLKFIIEGIGIVGMIIVLMNLYLLETGREKAKSRMYLAIGLSGSIILVIYSLLLESFTFTLLNLAFVAANLYFIITLNKRIKKKKRR